MAAWEVKREVDAVLLLGVGARDGSVEEGLEKAIG